MKPAFESPRSVEGAHSVSAYHRKEKQFLWNWHYHPEFELTHITSGVGTRLVGDQSEPYAAGDLVFVGPNLPHTWFSDTSISAVNNATVIQFRPEKIPLHFRALPEFAAIATLLDRSACGVAFPRETSDRLGPAIGSLANASGLGRWLELVRILDQLANTVGRSLASPTYWHGRSARLSTRAEAITSYIVSHHADDMPLPDLAKRFGLSPGAFSRFFRRTVGTTLEAYRTRIRIHAACRLLADGDLPITEIAFASGFRNLASFNRRFLAERKMTPSAYRRLYESRQR